MIAVSMLLSSKADVKGTEIFMGRLEATIEITLTDYTTHFIIRRDCAGYQSGGGYIEMPDFFLTVAGRKAAEQMIQSRERTGGKLLNGMTNQEQQAFIRYLKLAYENVKRG